MFSHEFSIEKRYAIIFKATLDVLRENTIYVLCFMF